MKKSLLNVTTLMRSGRIFDLSKTHSNMKLKDAIKKDPYLNPSNCTDLSDIEYAIDQLRNLDSIYGKENKTLLNLWRKFLDKKASL
jgi:hypothetical protein